MHGWRSIGSDVGIRDLGLHGDEPNRQNSGLNTGGCGLNLPSDELVAARSLWGEGNASSSAGKHSNTQ